MLDPILIDTDAISINRDKANLDIFLADAQAIYNLFTPMNIHLTLAEIQSLLNRRWQNTPSDFFNDFVADKIVAQAGVPTFNGVAIQPKKIRELIVIPDTAAAFQAIKSLAYANYGSTQNQGHGRSFGVTYLQLVNGVVSKIANASDLIETKYTYWTKNDRGAEVAVKLLDFIDSLKDFNNYLYNFDPDANVPQTMSEKQITSLSGFSIPGLIYRRQSGNVKVNDLVLDLAYIRKQEAANADYVAA